MGASSRTAQRWSTRWTRIWYASAVNGEYLLKEISLFTQDLDAQDISEILETVTDTVRTSVMATLDEDIRIQVNKLDTYADWEVGSYMDPDIIQVQDDISGTSAAMATR